MVVYKTTNIINGKFYIGKDAKNRTSYLGSGKALKAAIQKYGKHNFKKEVLEHCSSLRELSEREVYWIRETNAIDEGYNIARGGDGGNTGGRGGAKKGSVPWNKGKKAVQTAWNKGLGGLGVVKKNQTSFKSGVNHTQYGKKQDPQTVEKRVNTMKQNGTYGQCRHKGPWAPKQVQNIQDGLVFASIKEAAEFYGVSRNHVGHSCRQKTERGNFRFL